MANGTDISLSTAGETHSPDAELACRDKSYSVAQRPKGERIIMGIDPGTNLLGYGVLKVKGKQAQMLAMGVIDLRKVTDVYLKLGRIYGRINSLIASFLPDELSIESQFYGKNPQSMLKLGRAQGVAIAAAINNDVPIHEYAPLKIKMAITGNGRASKEQVSAMLQRYLNITPEAALFRRHRRPRSSLLPLCGIVLQGASHKLGNNRHRSNVVAAERHSGHAPLGKMERLCGKQPRKSVQAQQQIVLQCKT
jgi:crossover junction endodeoxyribonuclease RuvC